MPFSELQPCVYELHNSPCNCGKLVRGAVNEVKEPMKERRDIMLQLGWKAAPEQFPPTELTNYAIDAEKAGFDLLDVSDHFHPWSEAGQSSFTWTWLGAVAVQTNRIHMGPGITPPLLPRLQQQFPVTHLIVPISESGQVRR